MKRRRVLSAIGSGSALTVAGCLDGAGRSGGSSGVPDGMDVSTAYAEADVLTEEFSDRESTYFDWREEDHTVISDAETAEAQLVDDGEVATSLEETDFAESYLLVVRNGMQSQMNLAVERIERTDGGLDVNIAIEGPERSDDDLVTHSLLVRITDEEGIPDDVSVEIEGYT